MIDQIKAYNNERDAVLLTDNLAVFIDWALSKNQTFSSDLVAEIARRKMITASIGPYPRTKHSPVTL